MQRHGWVEINTFEVQHKRLDVRRDMVSLNYEGLRGVNASAANIEEALSKLKELEAKIAHFHESSKQEQGAGKAGKGGKRESNAHIETKQQRLDRIREEDKDRKVWREGRLIHRTEPELKTHTSYLTFAVLPQAWTEEEEGKMLLKWTSKGVVAP
jgi:tRNA (adenine57-N1/adenine58-N1)-methyltransferase